MAKKAIIFCPAVITFVRRDAEMLGEIYDQVDIRVLDTTKPIKLIWGLIKLFFFVLFNIRKYSLVCSWFVGYHSLFPFYFAQLFKIKTVAFLGGTECHNLPFYDHGNYRKTVYRWFTSRSLQHADVMLPVHESLISTELDYVKVKYPHQGLLAFNKKLAGKVEALHCGFKQEREVDLDGKIENTFLSVASNLSGKVYYRKGIDLFVKLAEANPQFQFTLVGNNYKGPKLSNLKIVSAIPYSELIDIYCKHQFYIQFSIAEGFPNALAEAMLYGCIPLGSNVFGIPDIIGDTGYVLKWKDIDLAQEILDTVITLPANEKRRLAEAAIEKVRNNYTLEQRFNKFKEVVGV